MGLNSSFSFTLLSWLLSVLGLSPRGNMGMMLHPVSVDGVEVSWVDGRRYGAGHQQTEVASTGFSCHKWMCVAASLWFPGGPAHLPTLKAPGLFFLEVLVHPGEALVLRLLSQGGGDAGEVGRSAHTPPFLLHDPVMASDRGAVPGSLGEESRVACHVCICIGKPSGHLSCPLGGCSAGPWEALEKCVTRGWLGRAGCQEGEG